MTQGAIVGGGISGCTMARLLNTNGFKTTLFEKGKLGGLISCSFESGNTYHRVGGHVFNSKDKQVLNWFWNHFDQENEFLLARRNAVILLEKKFISYPIELNLSQLPTDVGYKVIREIIAIAKAMPPPGQHNNFEDFLRNNFGETLCKQYFIPYNQKIWNRDLNSIPLEWLDGKLPMISPSEIIEKNIFQDSDNMVHSNFYYPKRGGSQFIIDRLSENLTTLNEEVINIHLQDNLFIINDVYKDNHFIVYTGDIRQVPDILSESTCKQIGMTDEICIELKSLDSNGTTTMLCECEKTDYSWVYLPGLDTKIHRIIMTGNFSPNNSAPDLPSNRTTCTVEYSGYLSELNMRSEIKKLPFDMKPVDYNYCQNSYIIHDSKTISLIRKTTRTLARHGIFCCGRFAEWEYYNMDAAISSAFRIASNLKSYLN